MIGHLHLTCQARGEVTYLSSQSFAAPMHLSKPYWDGSALIINAVNPTAGFFGDDEIDIQLDVLSGARAVFTSPSATLVHQTRDHLAPTRLCQSIKVGRAAWLDYCPEPTIPHAGSRFIQNTTIDIAAGGELFFQESWAPGRVARNEVFSFTSIHCSMELRQDGSLQLLERYVLRGGDESLQPLKAEYPASYHSMAVVVSERIADKRSFLHAVAANTDKGCRCGGSFITADICVIKVIAHDSLALRGAHRSLRSLVYSALDRPLPLLRKL